MQSVTAELTLDGTDYVIVPDGSPPAAPLLATVQVPLAASPTPLTHRELLERWPDEPLRQDSLWRALNRGVEEGVFVVSGSGTRTDAFRYSIPIEGQPSNHQRRATSNAS
jgi:hypothetical protein